MHCSDFPGVSCEPDVDTAIELVSKVDKRKRGEVEPQIPSEDKKLEFGMTSPFDQNLMSFNS